MAVREWVRSARVHISMHRQEIGSFSPHRYNHTSVRLVGVGAKVISLGARFISGPHFFRHVILGQPRAAGGTEMVLSPVEAKLNNVLRGLLSS